ncbi:hypothetical protein CSOJ01_03771 [Colletotrichum sojae]|uniref:Uncharacterized protein n=1 Tax=Colletotrichum sojae TaxID=2175907 RepID=A0A8H6JLJ2_9PEZI|nr:hypothetical protein CSOJ01_03771 [Colletotrichum sojae]
MTNETLLPVPNSSVFTLSPRCAWYGPGFPIIYIQAPTRRTSCRDLLRAREGVYRTISSPNIVTPTPLGEPDLTLPPLPCPPALQKGCLLNLPVGSKFPAARVLTARFPDVEFAFRLGQSGFAAGAGGSEAAASQATAGGHKRQRLHPPAQHVGLWMEATRAGPGGVDQRVGVGLSWAVMGAFSVSDVITIMWSLDLVNNLRVALPQKLRYEPSKKVFRGALPVSSWRWTADGLKLELLPSCGRPDPRYPAEEGHNFTPVSSHFPQRTQAGEWANAGTTVRGVLISPTLPKAVRAPAVFLWTRVPWPMVSCYSVYTGTINIDLRRLRLWIATLDTSEGSWGLADAHPSPANPLDIGLRLPLSNKLAPENQMPGQGQDDPTRSLGSVYSVTSICLGMSTHGAKYPEAQAAMDGADVRWAPLPTNWGAHPQRWELLGATGTHRRFHSFWKSSMQWKLVGGTVLPAPVAEANGEQRSLNSPGDRGALALHTAAQRSDSDGDGDGDGGVRRTKSMKPEAGKFRGNDLQGSGLMMDDMSRPPILSNGDFVATRDGHRGETTKTMQGRKPCSMLFAVAVK